MVVGVARSPRSIPPHFFRDPRSSRAPYEPFKQGGYGFVLPPLVLPPYVTFGIPRPGCLGRVGQLLADFLNLGFY